MALVHVVYVRPTPVDNTGKVISKDNSNTTIKTMMTASTDMRIVPDASSPSSVSSPDIRTYLTAEYLLGFILKYMDNTMIVTATA